MSGITLRMKGREVEVRCGRIRVRLGAAQIGGLLLTLRGCRTAYEFADGSTTVKIIHGAYVEGEPCYRMFFTRKKAAQSVELDMDEAEVVRAALEHAAFKAVFG